MNVTQRIAVVLGPTLVAVTLPEMHGHLAENVLELALGTNAGANRSTLDWRFNSPINESALGFHVAIGDGKLCPHVDFICACPDAYSSFFNSRA